MSFLMVLQVLLVVILIILVLVQSSGSEGMGGFSSGFGSAGGLGSLVSPKATSGFFVKVTIVVAVLFAVNSVFLGMLHVNNAAVVASGINKYRTSIKQNVDEGESDSQR